MTFSESVRTCLREKYFFRFKGRASRSEFWWFMLFIGLVNAASTLGLSLLPRVEAGSVSLAISLLLLPPNLGVTVRRLHDRNLRGWWLLLPIIGLLGWLIGSTVPQPGEPSTQDMISSALAFSMSLIYLVILMMPSQPGPNRFGPNPVEDPYMS